jgi:hypothetical protein
LKLSEMSFLELFTEHSAVKRQIARAVNCDRDLEFLPQIKSNVALVIRDFVKIQLLTLK